MNNTNDPGLGRRTLLLAGTTLAAASTLAAGAPSVVRAQTSSLNPQPLPPSPGWARALPPGPDTRVKITEAYAAHVARDTFFWAWPLINMYNRRLAFSKMKEHRYAGPLLEAPLNRLTMLTDYVDPEERNVACPNQDVVYGLGLLALDVSPVVIQVPDFGDRFWVYRLSICAPTASPNLARCTAPVPASTCWSARTGRARCQKESPGSFVHRAARVSRRRASSRTTRRKTGGRFRAC